MIVKKRPILRSEFYARPYLKCQVILDFEQQCRLAEKSSHACWTKCVGFLSSRSIDLGHKIENLLSFLWSWKKRSILRSEFYARPYIKCQVILDFEQQCRLAEKSSHACWTKCVGFLSSRSIDLGHKIENPLSFLWSWKNGRFSDPCSVVDHTSNVRWYLTLNSNVD